jgi:thiaminase
VPCAWCPAHPLHTCTLCPLTPCKVVEYLRGLLDATAATLSAAERSKVEAAFLRAVDIEVAFFDNAYASA